MDWSKTWQMKFNIDKCKVMHLGKRNENYEYDMACMEGPGERIRLQVTTEEKDLGVWTDTTLKPSIQVIHAVSKANQILGMIRRSFTYMDSQLMKQLYTALVRPILEYGNVVWKWESMDKKGYTASRKGAA